jgi:hypothetical protein
MMELPVQLKLIILPDMGSIQTRQSRKEKQTVGR